MDAETGAGADTKIVVDTAKKAGNVRGYKVRV
jgi:hypothetical protein